MDPKGFRRCDGFAGSIPQNFVNTHLPVCPLCGTDDPYWTLKDKMEFTAHRVMFRCKHCGGVVSATQNDFNGTTKSTAFAALTTEGAMNALIKKKQGKDVKTVYLRVEDVGEYRTTDELLGKELAIEEFQQMAAAFGAPAPAAAAEPASDVTPIDPEQITVSYAQSGEAPAEVDAPTEQLCACDAPAEVDAPTEQLCAACDAPVHTEPEQNAEPAESEAPAAPEAPAEPVQPVVSAEPAAPAQPVYQQPVYQQPVNQQPTYQQPVYQQPVYQQPVNQQPVYQQPVYQQPVYQQPVYQQPVYQQPVNQQPVYQQPVYQQPVYQQPVYQQPVNRQPVNRQPAAPAAPKSNAPRFPVAGFILLMLAITYYLISNLPSLIDGYFDFSLTAVLIFSSYVLLMLGMCLYKMKRPVLFGLGYLIFALIALFDFADLLIQYLDFPRYFTRYPENYFYLFDFAVVFILHLLVSLSYLVARRRFSTATKLTAALLMMIVAVLEILVWAGTEGYVHPSLAASFLLSTVPMSLSVILFSPFRK